MYDYLLDSGFRREDYHWFRQNHPRARCIMGNDYYVIIEPDSVRWLRKEWANVHRLKQDGVPLMGFTWFSLTDQVDWDTALREDNGRVNALGLCDLDRRLRPVGQAYQQLIARWKKVLPTESLVVGSYL